LIDLTHNGSCNLAHRHSLPGVIIHLAFRAHTAGSQLLEVPTSIGKLMFGSDAFSSYEGIRDWMVANGQTDTSRSRCRAIVMAPTSAPPEPRIRRQSRTN
jgi:hypothetical protein